MTVTTNDDVAAKVRGIAAEKRVTQASLADSINLSRMAMSRRFGGETPFTPEELIKLSQVLDTPVATFFGERAA